MYFKYLFSQKTVKLEKNCPCESQSKSDTFLLTLSECCLSFIKRKKNSHSNLKKKHIMLMQAINFIFIVLITVIFIFMSACTTTELQPMPEHHPADSSLKSPIVPSPATLDESEPVDPSPARSKQWEKHPDEHHEHNMHHEAQKDEHNAENDNGTGDFPEKDHLHNDGQKHQRNEHQDH